MIEALLVDLGNVVAAFDHDRMWRAMAALAGVDRDGVVTGLSTVMFDELERGDLDDAGLHGRFEALFGVEVDPEALGRAVGDIFTVDPAMLDLLGQARAVGVRTVAFSNTCGLHVAQLDRLRALDHFDALVFSHAVGARKPEDAMFDAAVAELAGWGIAPGSCLYTDDIAEYVEAGERRGLRGEVFVGSAAWATRLRAEGLMLTTVANDT